MRDRYQWNQRNRNTEEREQFPGSIFHLKSKSEEAIIVRDILTQE